MKISRLDLDGAGSPKALIARILEVEPNLPVPVPLEELCQCMDIVSIGDLHTGGFAAALVTDAVKSAGHILVAKGTSPRRRRFSIGHELGHFLIPTHSVPADGQLLCSAEDFRLLDLREQNRHRRMEAEANRFAALLLMPPPLLTAELRKLRDPAVNDIVRLARLFDVSKEAMARAVVENDRRALAVIVVRDGKVARHYRNEQRFPWIDIERGQPVPTGSAWQERIYMPGETSEIDECGPELWLSSSSARKVDILTEQVLGQAEGFAMILLHAELREDN